MTVEQVLALYRAGSYGTPDQPIRSSSVKQVFWDVYFGHRSAAEYRGHLLEAAAKAGAIASKTP
jgi:hypothetical protein